MNQSGLDIQRIKGLFVLGFTHLGESRHATSKHDFICNMFFHIFAGFACLCTLHAIE